MNNNFEQAVAKLKTIIDEEPLIVEYRRLKTLIENDEEIKEIQEKVVFYQKEMCKKMDDDEKYLHAKEEYEKYEKVYRNHPLVINFKELQQDVFEFLNEIKQILQE